MASGSSGPGAEVDAKYCAICQDALNADTEEASFLACAHGFHSYCLNTYMQVKQCTDPYALPCPVCRKVGGSHVSAEMHLEEPVEVARPSYRDLQCLTSI